MPKRRRLAWFTNVTADICIDTRIRERSIKLSVLPAEAHCLTPTG